MSLHAKLVNILAVAAAAFLLCSSAQAGDLLYNLPATSGSGVNLDATQGGGQTNIAYIAVQDLVLSDVYVGDLTDSLTDTWSVDALTVRGIDNEGLAGVGASFAPPAIDMGPLHNAPSVQGFYNYMDTGANGKPRPDPLAGADVDVNLGVKASPEPSTWILLGVGIGILGLVRRRRG